MLIEIIGDLPIESSNHKFLARFHSGTPSIIDTMRLMSLFELLLEHLIEFLLRRPKSEKKSKILKPKNKLFCDLKAITSLRLNLFQQSNV